MSLLDALGGEKIPGAFNKNSPVGATVTGTIVKAEIVQMRDYTTGDPKFWEDGNPMNQIRIVLDVPAHGEQQAIYVKVWGTNSIALKEAVLAAGMSDLDKGATMTATFTHEIPNADNPKMSPTKAFAYALKAATATAGMFADTTTGEIVAAPTAATVPVAVPAPAVATAVAPLAAPIAAAPVAAPVAAAPAPQVKTLVDEIRELASAGLDPQGITNALGTRANLQLVTAVLSAA